VQIQILIPPLPPWVKDVLHASVNARSDKLFDSSNAGPSSTFSRGRAAFRCVSPIEGSPLPQAKNFQGRISHRQAA
jgi:hypothetical protein